MCGGRVLLVIPLGNRQGGDLGEDLRRTDAFKVFFNVAVAATVDGAGGGDIPVGGHFHDIESVGEKVQRII